MRGGFCLLAAVTACVACADPVHTDAVDALGDEAPGVAAGPLHRGGQPCMTCHGGEGPADLEFSFAGTVYSAPKGGVPVGGATVRVVDRTQRTSTVESNCAGNFYVRARDFPADFPAITAVSTTSTLVMRTEMHRSGSCADCHGEPPGPGSPGAVWAPAPPGAPACEN